MNTLARQLTGGAGEVKRRELDFYPTPPETTVALMDFLNNLFPISDYMVWEPACGKGHMVEVLRRYCYCVKGTDIQIRNNDYLKMHMPIDTFDAIITNPPFALSEQFIRKAVTEAPMVCMLLKSQYWHAQKRLTLFKEFTPAYILPLTWRPDFYFDENRNKPASSTMECMWVVWVDGQKFTQYIPLEKPSKI